MARRKGQSHEGNAMVSQHWKSWMHLVQSSMHPSMWLMLKGRRTEPSKRMSEPAQEAKFAETHTWVMGAIKGRIALFVDELLQ